MSWVYRLIKRDNKETSLTLDTQVKHLYWGSTGTPNPLDTADDMGVAYYFSTAATSGTTYAEYIRLDASGAGVEAIAGRHKVLLTGASVGNAHGHHATLELGATTSKVTGLGTGLRGNVVVTTQVVTTGTYYGVLGEIFPNDANAALPAGANACLGANCQSGTAMDLVANAIAFGGADGTGKMIYTHTAAGTQHGTIRVIINGVKKWIPFMSAE